MIFFHPDPEWTVRMSQIPGIPDFIDSPTLQEDERVQILQKAESIDKGVRKLENTTIEMEEDQKEEKTHLISISSETRRKLEIEVKELRILVERLVSKEREREAELRIDGELKMHTQKNKAAKRKMRTPENKPTESKLVKKKVRKSPRLSLCGFLISMHMIFLVLITFFGMGAGTMHFINDQKKADPDILDKVAQQTAKNMFDGINKGLAVLETKAGVEKVVDTLFEAKTAFNVLFLSDAVATTSQFYSETKMIVQVDPDYSQDTIFKVDQEYSQHQICINDNQSVLNVIKFATGKAGNYGRALAHVFSKGGDVNSHKRMIINHFGKKLAEESKILTGLQYVVTDDAAFMGFLRTNFIMQLGMYSAPILGWMPAVLSAKALFFAYGTTYAINAMISTNALNIRTFLIKYLKEKKGVTSSFVARVIEQLISHDNQKLLIYEESRVLYQLRDAPNEFEKLPSGTKNALASSCEKDGGLPVCHKRKEIYKDTESERIRLAERQLSDRMITDLRLTLSTFLNKVANGVAGLLTGASASMKRSNEQGLPASNDDDNKKLTSRLVDILKEEGLPQTTVASLWYIQQGFTVLNGVRTNAGKPAMTLASSGANAEHKKLFKDLVDKVLDKYTGIEDAKAELQGKKYFLLKPALNNDRGESFILGPAKEDLYEKSMNALYESGTLWRYYFQKYAKGNNIYEDLFLHSDNEQRAFFSTGQLLEDFPFVNGNNKYDSVIKLKKLEKKIVDEKDVPLGLKLVNFYSDMGMFLEQHDLQKKLEKLPNFSVIGVKKINKMNDLQMIEIFSRSSSVQLDHKRNELNERTSVQNCIKRGLYNIASLFLDVYDINMEGNAKTITRLEKEITALKKDITALDNRKFLLLKKQNEDDKSEMKQLNNQMLALQSIVGKNRNLQNATNKFVITVAERKRIKGFKHETAMDSLLKTTGITTDDLLKYSFFDLKSFESHMARAKDMQNRMILQNEPVEIAKRLTKSTEVDVSTKIINHRKVYVFDLKYKKKTTKITYSLKLKFPVDFFRDKAAIKDLKDNMNLFSYLSNNEEKEEMKDFYISILAYFAQKFNTGSLTTDPKMIEFVQAKGKGPPSEQDEKPFQSLQKWTDISNAEMENFSFYNKDDLLKAQAIARQRGQSWLKLRKPIQIMQTLAKPGLIVEKKGRLSNVYTFKLHYKLQDVKKDKEVLNELNKVNSKSFYVDDNSDIATYEFKLNPVSFDRENKAHNEMIKHVKLNMKMYEFLSTETQKTAMKDFYISYLAYFMQLEATGLDT